MIETACLTKSFKLAETEVPVLKGISLTVNSGEFVSMMGPSGSGKSTLLYLLGGLDSPTSGSVIIEGKELSGLNDTEESSMRRRKIGFVFQFYNLIPNMSVEENIMLPVLLDGKKMKNYKNKLEEILHTVGLSDRRHHMPRELSGGQQQRVAIARALMNDPNIILADEPTGNLDSKAGVEILQLLKKINKEQGKTIVMVTHSEQAAEYGKRIINLKDGMLN